MSVSKPSRLARVRRDRVLLIGCMTVSALLLGTIGIQQVSAGNQRAEAARIAEEQKKLAESQKKQAETARKVRSKAWIAWRDYIEPRCNDTVPMLRDGMNVTRLKRHQTNQPVFEGLVICDRDRVGIVKRETNRMIVTYLVPRFGSSYPLPTSEPPPPEFAPYQSNQ